MNSDQPAIEGDLTKEACGWLSLVLLMMLFPLLFFLCVFFPIWLGIAVP